MLKTIFVSLLLTSGFLISTAFASEDSVQMITDRHHPEAFVQSIQQDPEAGKKVYAQFCATCHAKNPSIDIGAPRIGVKKDWEKRMQKGLDGLTTVAIAGLNQMPPRGGCFECSDAQLKAAIVYMLQKTNKK